MRRSFFLIATPVLVLCLVTVLTSGCSSGKVNPVLPGGSGSGITPGNPSDRTGSDGSSGNGHNGFSLAGPTDVIDTGVAGATEDALHLLVVLSGTPQSVYADVQQDADFQFSQIKDLSDQIKQIYRDQKPAFSGISVQSQVTPLVEQVEALKEERANFIRQRLESVLGPMQDDLVAKLEAIDGTIVKSRDVLQNVLGVQTSLEHIEEIKALDGVLEVIIDNFELIPNLDISAQALKLRSGSYPNTVWNQGFTGQGIDAMSMDTGVYTGHSALAGISFLNQKFPTWYGPCTWGDDYNHGTMTCGTIASQNAAYKGMAYGLQTYYNAKMCDGAFSLNDTIMAAYEWAALGGSGYNDAEVINFSMGYADTCSQNNGLDFISSYVDQAVDLYGVVWSISAGNRGQGCAGNYIFDKPATCYNGVSVAGIQANGTGNRGNDTYYNISKFGPVKGIDGSEDRLKPDIATYTIVTAPGYDGGWYWFDGTSAAAPHFSGLATVLLSAGVTSSMEIRALTFATAEDFTGSPAGLGPDYYTGFGNADAWAAYSHIGDTYSDTLTITNATKSYQILNVQQGNMVVLVFDKHGAYPSYQMSNINLKAYDISDGSLLYQTSNLYENKEYIRFSSADVGKNIRIDANLQQIAGGYSGEDYAISANATMTETDTSALTVDITNPAPHTIDRYDILTVSADITNKGTLTVTGATATIDIPGTWELISGANPQNLGTLNPSQTKTATWHVFAKTSGSNAVTVGAEGTSGGSPVSDSDAVSLNTTNDLLLTAPSTVNQGANFNVYAAYKNNSPNTYSGLVFTLNYDSSKVSINSGQNPSLEGDVNSGINASAAWNLKANVIGSTQVSLNVDFTYLSQNINFTTDPITITLADPTPPPDPNVPILLLPADGTEYTLGNSLLMKWKKGSGQVPTGYYLNAWLDGVHSPLIPSGGIFLGNNTSLLLDKNFMELTADDGLWKWAIGAKIGTKIYWSDKWIIKKYVTPVLIIPQNYAAIPVGQMFNWDTIPGALNYVAKVTGLLPGNAPYYLPLNSQMSNFQLTSEYYAMLKPDQLYSWSIAATNALGAQISAGDQVTLSKLSYSQTRFFSLE